MEREASHKPNLEELIPVFAVRDTEGSTVSSWDFKGKNGLLVFFFDPRSSRDWEVLSEIRRRNHELRDANAKVVAIGSGPMNELVECEAGVNPPFRLFSDGSGRARKAYGISAATILVADCFGALKMYSDVLDDIDAVLDAAVSKLELADLECPECSESAWPEP